MKRKLMLGVYGIIFVVTFLVTQTMHKLSLVDKLVTSLIVLFIAYIIVEASKL